MVYDAILPQAAVLNKPIAKYKKCYEIAMAFFSGSGMVKLCRVSSKLGKLWLYRCVAGDSMAVVKGSFS